MRLARYSVTFRQSIGVIAAALAVLGIYGLSLLPVDLLPDITYPMVKIHIWWSGATPEEIDKNIADPIERQMATVDNLDYIESSAIEGMYTLLVNFKYGTNVDMAYQDVLAAMQRVARNLPQDMDPPIIIKADPSQLPVVQITVSSRKMDLVKLRTWVDNWFQDQLLAVPGVAGTEIVGGLKREIRIHLDVSAMEKYGLTFAAVGNALENENVDQFGGRVTAENKEFIARTLGEFESLEEIGSIVVARKGAARIRLRDIAEIVDANEEARVITRLDGNACVKLNVLKQSDANTIEVADAVIKRLETLRGAIPDGVMLGIVENQADYVRDALSGVKESAWQSAILVVFIIYLFLGSFRQVLTILLAIPLTLIINFGLMKLAGFSMNIFSLGGLVIAIGVLVDNSTVVIENATRFRELKPDAPLKELLVESTGELLPALIAATLSFLCLFVPFLIVPGMISLLFRELILVMAGIVVISLLVALTLTPMLMSLLLGKPRVRKPGLAKRFFTGINNAYAWSLHAAMKGKYITILIFAALLAAAVIGVGHLGFEFLPPMDDGRVMVKVKLPAGAALGETDRILARIEALAKGDPDVESVFTLCGGKVWGLYTYEIANEGEVNIQLVPRSKRKISTARYIAKLRPEVAKIQIPGGMAMPMQMKLKGIRKIGDADIEVKVKGQDVGELYKLAGKVAAAMRLQPELTNVHLSLDMSKPEYKIKPDRQRAGEFGISMKDIAGTLRSLISGAVFTRYRDGGEYYNIRMMIPETKLTDRNAVANLILETANGGFVRLHDVAEVSEAVGPVELVRENQVKQVIVRGDVSGGSVGTAIKRLEKELQGIQRPAGYEFSLGGQAQMIDEMRRTVTGVLFFAVFFSFVILAVQFNSLRLPVVVIAGIPFCFTGFIMILGITGLPLGATVIIGALIVFSAAINDGVLLLTFAEQLKKQEGMNTFDATLNAAKIRFRPRVMTTLSTLVGFIPLALAFGSGGDMLVPMATAAIGGLLAELFVSLYLTPCFYLIASGRDRLSPPEAVEPAAPAQA